MRKKNVTPINLMDDSTDYIRKISVDLPNCNEMNMGRESFNSLENRISTTDMARLTGAKEVYEGHGFYRFYLRDLSDDERNILYADTHYINADKRDLYDFNRAISINRWIREFSILPTLHFEECPELFYILIENFSSDGKTIELGEFPQAICIKDTQDRLNEAFKNSKVKETEETYVFDAVNPFSGEYGRGATSLVSKVYEFEGKKYLRWKIIDLYDFGKGRSNKKILSIDSKYHCGDTVWVEIAPVKYLIIREEKILIADSCLVSGIQYTNHDINALTISYPGSNVKFYMDTFMKPKLLKNVSKMLRNKLKAGKKYKLAIDKMYEETDPEFLPSRHDLPTLAQMLAEKFDEDYSGILAKLRLYNLPKEVLDELLGPNEDDDTKKTDESKLNEKTKEIMAIRNEVIKYINYDIGEPELLEKVDNLIKTYNEKVKTYNELELTLNPGGNSPHNLYLRLKVDLNEIVGRLRAISEKVISFIDMLEILDECKKNNINENFDDICRMIKVAKSIINGFLLNEDRKKRLNIELDEIINKNINSCRKGIDNYKKHNIVSTKTLDNHKIDFRKDIRPFLYNLRRAVNEQDVVNSITENVKITLAEQRKEIEDERIAYFVKEIAEVTSRIREKGNEEEKQELKAISNSLNVDKTQDIHKVIRGYVDALSRVIHLEDKIELRKAKEKARNDNIINIPESSTVNKR